MLRREQGRRRRRLRATQSEGGELRLMLQEGIERNRDEAASMSKEEGRRWRDDLAISKDNISAQISRLNKGQDGALKELRTRMGSCWEGLRESRVELGDVMQTLHHLVERSEIQHVVNQLLTRAAYSRDIGGGGGGGGSPDRGFGGRAITSPRVGLAESSPSKAATQAAPHLPSQLAHHHRKCLKKGSAHARTARCDLRSQRSTACFGSVV